MCCTGNSCIQICVYAFDIELKLAILKEKSLSVTVFMNLPGMCTSKVFFVPWSAAELDVLSQWVELAAVSRKRLIKILMFRHWRNQQNRPQPAARKWQNFTDTPTNAIWGSLLYDATIQMFWWNFISWQDYYEIWFGCIFFNFSAVMRWLVYMVFHWASGRVLRKNFKNSGQKISEDMKICC